MLSAFLQRCRNILFSPLASRGLGCCARADCFTLWDLVQCSHVKRFVCFKKVCAVIVKECIKCGVNKLNWCEGLIGFGGERCRYCLLLNSVKRPGSLALLERAPEQ